jgi:DNA-binding response OmpR family regulator
MTAATPAPRQVLLVDDEPEILRLMALSLHGLNVEMHTAADGEEALEWLRTHVPDLVVLDVMMPRMNGVDLYRRMLADERLRHVPVLVVSVIYADEDLISDSPLSGLPTMRKPFSPVALAARVRELLEDGGTSGG